jgi:hypothetical protein
MSPRRGNPFPARPAALASDDPDHAAHLVRQVTERAEAAEREGRTSDVERFVLAHGRSYGRVAPGRTTLMARNTCHQNAASLAESSGLTYVEGYALVAVPNLCALDHAWCVDADGRVVEPTWREPGLTYFGVRFAPAYVARLMAVADEPEHGLLRGRGCGPLLDGDEPSWQA